MQSGIVLTLVLLVGLCGVQARADETQSVPVGTPLPTSGPPIPIPMDGDTVSSWATWGAPWSGWWSQGKDAPFMFRPASFIGQGRLGIDMGHGIVLRLR